MIGILCLMIIGKFTFVLMRLTKELSAMNQQKEDAKKQKEKREQYQKERYQQRQEESSQDFHIPTPWEILGVLYGCKFSDVKRKYYTLAKQYHPDHAGRNGINEDEAIIKMQKINAAYAEVIRFYR